MRSEWLVVLAAPFVGSFLGVLVQRVPSGEPVVLARSACDACKTRLNPAELIPVVSWALQRGRCRSCGAEIGVFAPAIELSAVAVALWSIWALDGGLAVAGSVLGWSLLALAVIDWRHLVLPDVMTLPLLPLGLLVVFVFRPLAFWDHVIGAVLGFLLFFMLRAAYFKLRASEGLGLGDVKFLGSAGAWVGWSGLPWVVLVAAAAGLAGTFLSCRATSDLTATTRVPFGVYLAGGLWLVWLYGPAGAAS